MFYTCNIININSVNKPMSNLPVSHDSLGLLPLSLQLLQDIFSSPLLLLEFTETLEL